MREKMMEQLLIRRTWPAYGAIELMRSYRPNLRRGFVFSVVLHLLLVATFWVTVTRELNEPSTRTVQISLYEELPSTLGPAQPEFGLKAHPIVIRSDAATGSGSTPVRRPSSAWVTKKANSRPRALGQGLGDLPSAMPNDKINANSLAPLEPDAAYDRNDAVGGGNRNNVNTVRGGIPVMGRSGESPSGAASSGIASAAKPAPGLYGQGGRGGSDFFGDGSGGGVGYSMKWLQGGTRKKVAGDLPKYPDGVKVEAEIKLLAVVGPKGSIGTLQPAQKGNPRLEEAAMKEVRYWRFEPLRPSQPQIDQRCEIVFLFTLK